MTFSLSLVYATYAPSLPLLLLRRNKLLSILHLIHLPLASHTKAGILHPFPGSNCSPDSAARHHHFQGVSMEFLDV